MLCQTCDIQRFSHDVIGVVRLQLLQKFLELQIEYFQDQTTFTNWIDYNKRYFEHYHDKFEDYFHGLDICNAFLSRDICVCSVAHSLDDLELSEVTGVKLIEEYLNEEKSLASLSRELKELIRNFMCPSVICNPPPT